jgi:hypothetical protein
MATQNLIHYTAGCLTCGASVAARNATAWAHNHANRHGHRVELSLGYIVYCDTPASQHSSTEGK